MMQIHFFTLAFLVFLAIFLIVSYWLNKRQVNAVQASFKQVPQQFSEKISLDAHQKAAKYTQAKLKFSYKQSLLGAAILLLWTLGGGLELLDDVWVNLGLSQLYQGTGFILSFILISSFIDLPSSWYKTFVLEQKFGFNKMSGKIFIQDTLKATILTLIFGTLLIAAILYLMAISGQLWWVYVWVLLVSISLLMLWLYPSYIAPLFNKFKPLEDEALAKKITQLLNKAGFNSNGIFVMDGSKRSSHGNAYFTGIGKQKRIVFFDTLLKGLSHNEVLAILGHELGHFHHKHIRTQMLSSFSLMFVFLAVLGYVIDKDWFYQGLGVGVGIEHNSPYMALVLFVLCAPIFTFLTSPLSSLLSRKHEYQADAFAAKHTQAEHLISALVGLYRDNASTLTPDKYYSLFYDSHPSAGLRITHLQRCTTK